jgi:uncharacterized protein YbjT (DUF2867 family)
MQKVIISGATGMIGSLILQRCLDSNEVNEIISITRRKSGRTHPKLKEKILTDFNNYHTLRNELSDANAAFFCLGVYTGQLPDDQFRQITFDYAIAFAEAAKEANPNIILCFLSGAGADLKEKSRLSFARYKGMAENHLLQLQFKYLNIFRPGYIYPVQKRKEPNFSYRLFRFLYPAMKYMMNNSSITSEELAEAMFRAALLKKNHGILENRQIKQIIS